MIVMKRSIQKQLIKCLLDQFLDFRKLTNNKIIKNKYLSNKKLKLGIKNIYF
jgi:hypothetical protein